MAGIYIHIPFCYSRCSYCDFYKTTNQQYKGEFINALCKEIASTASSLVDEDIKTIYFGGGTPSTLLPAELEEILNTIFKIVSKDTVEELTVEVNPDDITEDYIRSLVKLGVNRLSMGVQSFNESHLRKMNRRHNANQAQNAINIAQKNGIENMSIDLIYGLPYMSFSEWKLNVEAAIDSRVQHISAYHLTFEKGTLYYDYLKKGKFSEVPEEASVEQFEYLVESLKKAGFENYEISNFALPGLQSKHNSNYWTGEKYFGFGPSAHSFDGENRQWNIRDLNKYCQAIFNNEVYFETEKLNVYDRYNETIMLGLRTQKGFLLETINAFNNTTINRFFKEELDKQLLQENIEIVDNYCRVKENKRFITDRLISEFFYIEDD